MHSGSDGSWGQQLGNALPALGLRQDRGCPDASEGIERELPRGGLTGVFQGPGGRHPGAWAPLQHTGHEDMGPYYVIFYVVERFHR